ncbi:MAG TPA: NAD+ synthase [Phycisphaerales bacterium]|nr:NAD+ synthase [Phycisphaerales bacterium]
MRLALAQINPTIGDIAGNAALIVRAIDEARSKGADLVVLPELCLCGYPPKDLLLQEGFVEACVAAAKDIGQHHTAGITAIFGTPLPVDAHNPDAKGSGIANALLAYRDGIFVDYYDKRLLPTYDVFEEDRYFVHGERAVVIDVPVRGGAALQGRAPITWRVGLTICEDLWRGEDAGVSHRYHGRKDPVAELCAPQPGGKAGAKLIINPSASPFVMGKGRRHREILVKHATANRVFVAAVNQVGGNDDLIFDGHAAVYAPGGALMGAAEGFVEQVLICDLPDMRPGPTDPVPALPNDPLLSAPDEELLYKALVLGIRDYCRKTGFTSAVLGLSGGIDSAVAAVLAAGALGPRNVLGVSLPSRFSSEGSKSDAAALAHRLGMEMLTIPIEPAHAALLGMLGPAFEAGRAGAARFDTGTVSEENLQSRIRGTVLMGLSNKFGHILLTTGNKSETAVGYATLYGDMNGGLAVLSDVTKHWVYRLARWMNERAPEGPPIPEASITKPPSAELRPNQTDQDSLPPYDVLDEVLRRYVEGRQHPRRIIAETGFDAAVVARIVRLIDLSEYKRKQAAVGLKVSGIAFGSGRRWPIAQRWGR